MNSELQKAKKMPNFYSIFVCARPSRFCVMCTSACVCPQIFPWKTMLSKVFEPSTSTGCFLYIDGYIKDINCHVLSGAHTKAESVQSKHEDKIILPQTSLETSS